MPDFLGGMGYVHVDGPGSPATTAVCVVPTATWVTNRPARRPATWVGTVPLPAPVVEQGYPRAGFREKPEMPVQGPHVNREPSGTTGPGCGGGGEGA
jgi:hypothetical protein